MTMRRYYLLLLAVLLLAGCGFQPRGEVTRPPAAMEPLLLRGLAEHHPFLRELRRQLERAGVQLATSADEAGGVLRISLKQESRIFSVNANNAAVEYEYLFTLRFDAEQPPGTSAGSGELQARRIVYAPGGQLLGRVREGEMRRRDVYSDLARRLIRRLAAL
ncbi:MAG TPA: hypothetical protein ENJ98_01150 [Thiolapillus brandeum]|uniref:LPS-assembly lipoprotein LptE n=1 Tax=Thiolapillus brandeum TaxID=1076588 RepID=A0A7C5MW61_9GAMM|nr:hypothetical protein [Thiolapillus brandeum]